MVSPYVVTVLQRDGARISRGSGFISSSGHVVTVAHVILQSTLPVYIGRQGKQG